MSKLTVDMVSTMGLILIVHVLSVSYGWHLVLQAVIQIIILCIGTAGKFSDAITKIGVKLNDD